ncbi:MAG: M14 family zinc carboxypeptidase [Kofleriaceae bacterium]
MAWHCTTLPSGTRVAAPREMRVTLVALVAVIGCSDPDPEAALDDRETDVVAADVDVDVDVDAASADDADTDLRLAPAVTRLFYGTTVEQQTLIYYRIRPAAANGKSAFLTFAVHGFEDAWAQDGRALYSIAHAAIEFYGDHPERLAGWTLYIVPSANPDGMRYGTNNLREQAGAYGRCTAAGKDINRNTSAGTSREQRALKGLFDQLDPTIAIDLHGWYNTYYGNARIGGYFQRSFNAAYTGKPARYCFVAASGVMDCGSTLGGSFHGTTSISRDLFAEWVQRERGKPAALIEYPAPDFNNNGLYDTVFDSELGFRRIGKNTLAKLWSRTRVALDNLFATF